MAKIFRKLKPAPPDVRPLEFEIITNSVVPLADDVAKTSTNAYKHSFKYADRVRMRGVQDPVSHNFPYSFDDAILASQYLKTTAIKCSS